MSVDSLKKHWGTGLKQELSVLRLLTICCDIFFQTGLLQELVFAGIEMETTQIGSKQHSRIMLRSSILYFREGSKRK